QLGAIPGLSSTNLGIFKQFVPAAPSNDAGTILVAGNAIPVGSINIPSPNFTNNNNVQVNIDYSQSEQTRHTGRFIYNHGNAIDTNTSLPQFFQPTPLDTRLFSYTLLHTFTPTLTNESRLAYSRFVLDIPAGNFSYPGLDVFPTINLNDLGLQLGPDGNAPQSTVINNYQAVDNIGYVRGNHSFKAGVDYRKLIAPQTFIQRSRGQYIYNSTDLFLRDIIPDNLAERNVGLSPYEGNQSLLFLFGQDDWKIRPNLTLNLGVNYVYQEVPFSARQQTLNSLASVPGLIEFNEPTSQKHNFAPRVGIAYSPNYDSGVLHWLFGSNNKSSIRAGFSMGYDVIFDNLYVLSLPPEQTFTIDANTGSGTGNFLGSGGIKPAFAPITDPATARASTSAFVPNQQVPYSLTYTLSYQRQFAQDWGLELRYLGTRGVHLLTQSRINRVPEVTATNFLPTFFTTPSASQLAGLPTAGSRFSCFPGASTCSEIGAFSNAGFGQNITAFLSNGYSTYNGFSAQLTHRLASGLQGSAAYTWSHLIDNSTAEVDSTALTPRRPQDFQNIGADRSDSVLDRRNRFVLGLVYDLPFLKDREGLLRSVAGGWSVAGTYTFESGEPATVQSGIDSNLNGDAAGDRVLVNPNGISGTSTTVTPIDSSGHAASNISSTVAYVANDPNAQYVQAGPGAQATGGRNTLILPRIDNVDFSIFKNFRIREGMKVQFRVDMLNALNHPQWTPGSVDGVNPITTAAANALVTAGNLQFNRPDLVFSSNPRIIQMGLRFDF
ncbi:MAG TPA: carboxypeptidase regulatory-like domain-containing protein, partial [Blastocatellia bacterium]|nr:carboxypeptidase regulatory-like domain-containing protein [Blastocatellia bacterium]